MSTLINVKPRYQKNCTTNCSCALNHCCLYRQDVGWRSRFLRIEAFYFKETSIEMNKNVLNFYFRVQNTKRDSKRGVVKGFFFFKLRFSFLTTFLFYLNSSIFMHQCLFSRIEVLVFTHLNHFPQFYDPFFMNKVKYHEKVNDRI